MFSYHKEKIDYTKISKQEWMEISEAINLFSGITIFISNILIPKDRQKELSRERIFYEPSCLITNEQQEISKKFRKLLLKEIQYRMENGIFPLKIKTMLLNEGLQIKLKDRSLYFLETNDLLYWAVGKGMVLPQDLQKAFKINQINQEFSSLGKVKTYQICIQALGQLLWFLDSNTKKNKIIQTMEKIIINNTFEGKKVFIKTPLNSLIKRKNNTYFKKEKIEPLNNLLKIVDPRPIHQRRGPSKRGTEKSSKAFPIKSIPDVFHNGKTDFPKLRLIILIIKEYLEALGLISKTEESFQHPLIQHYIERKGDRIKSFVKFWISYDGLSKQYSDMTYKAQNFRWKNIQNASKNDYNNFLFSLKKIIKTLKN